MNQIWEVLRAKHDAIEPGRSAYDNGMREGLNQAMIAIREPFEAQDIAEVISAFQNRLDSWQRYKQIAKETGRQSMVEFCDIKIASCLRIIKAFLA